ncbi:M28 family peptidase [Anabaena sp. FACHB-1237]|uniref:M28 family peptidase n=1 Tax=Anabaena sp. FACHB-1237 TaxID=2692769 RepID=UPI001680FDDF|nr:M28 family peptidase [Anabaena sp. FACHB-1237]MBD2136184.1 M28 family peptidase [Anabaena sp. FACHB-1237]
MSLKQRLINHLREVARERHPYLSSGGHFFVQEYIRQQFSQWEICGGQVEIQNFDFGNISGKNIILHLAGEIPDLPPILIAAHYDAVPGTVGADDNATGVAVLLELAQSFAQKPIQYPVQFIAFDLEEYGLFGSLDYAKKFKQQQQKLRLMISLEMLGYCDRRPHSQKYPPFLKYFYPHQGNFIAFIGNFVTLKDLLSLSKNMQKSGIISQWLPTPMRGFLVPQTRFSDHSPFWDQGYPAIMVTDTAFMRNPHYHQPSDTIDSLDLDFLTGVCSGLELGIRNL